jgi:hypothetical protein
LGERGEEEEEEDEREKIIIIKGIFFWQKYTFGPCV